MVQVPQWTDFDVCYRISSEQEWLSTLIHQHDYLEIFLCVTANARTWMHETEYQLLSHDLLIIPPGIIHKFVYPKDEPYIRYHLFVRPDYLRKVCRSEETAAFFLESKGQKRTLPFDKYTRLGNLLHNAICCVQDPACADSCLPQLYVAAILHEIHLLCDPGASALPPKNNANLKQVLHYLDTHYSQPVTLEDLSQALYLNRAYVCRMFKKHMGMSVMQYVQHKRVLKAQELLLHSQSSASEISLECGFNHLQHFYRVFKQLTGLTPNQFKKESCPAAEPES